MNLKKISFWEPEFGSEEEIAVVEAVKSGYLNDGLITRKFEDKIKNFLKV